MRRKDQPTQSLPTRVYSFGARIDLPPELKALKQAEAIPGMLGPRVHAPPDEAIHILRLANRYKNKRIELVNTYRRTVDHVVRRLDPSIVAVEAQITAIDAQIDSVYGEVRKVNIVRRQRLEDPVAKVAVQRLREEREPLYQHIKRLRRAVFTSETFKAEQKDLQARSHAEGRAARAACGIYHGTYVCVEAAVEAAAKATPWGPLGFHHLDRGSIVVQLQGDVLIRDIVGYTNPADPASRYTRRQSPHQVRSTLFQLDGEEGWVSGRIRTGTIPGTIQPIWLPFHTQLHRPIPPDARVTWAKLVGRKVATHWVWELQLTLSRAAGWDDPQRELERGAVAVDVGWRRKPEGLRVAYWADAAGQHGELVISHERIARWQKVCDLQSIRDKNFDVVVGRLRAWIATADFLPTWFSEAVAHIHTWAAQARLAGVVLRWRDNRFAGDEDIYPVVEAWRKQDKHLYEWEENQRRGNQHWRDDLYRKFAAHLRRTYRTVIVEDMDMRPLKWVPEPTEADTEQEQLARYYGNIASASYLRGFIKQKATNYIEAPTEFTTQTCHCCGFTEAFDAAASIQHQCRKCGQVWDQDYNACRNLLRLASGPVGGNGSDPLVSPDLSVDMVAQRPAARVG